MSQQGTSRLEKTMVWLREIFWITAVHNFRVTSCYIQTTNNTTADTLSRLPKHLSADNFLSLLHSDQSWTIVIMPSIYFSLLPKQVEITLRECTRYWGKAFADSIQCTSCSFVHIYDSVCTWDTTLFRAKHWHCWDIWPFCHTPYRQAAFQTILTLYGLFIGSMDILNI